MDDGVEHPFYFIQDDAAAVEVVDDEELLVSLGFLLPPPPVVELQQPDQGSAFAAYQSAAVLASSSSESLSRRYGSAPANVHRRMHEYLRKIDDAGAAGTGTTMEMQAAAGEHAVEHQAAPRGGGGGGGSARFRHIMRERLRRESLSQGYADLKAILPTGASKKGGKNFIVGEAANYIRQLEGRKGWLRAQNEELERVPPPPPPPKPGAGMVVKVRAESEFSSMVDVFEAVLRRLKAMEELQVTAIQSCFCACGMWMNVAVESKISSREVDKAITNALRELQEIESSCMQDPIFSKTSFSCQVESVLLMS